MIWEFNQRLREHHGDRGREYLPQYGDNHSDIYGFTQAVIPKYWLIKTEEKSHN